jgi:hypothetical protein
MAIEEADESVEAFDEFMEGIRVVGRVVLRVVGMMGQGEWGLEGGRVVHGDESVEQLVRAPHEPVDRRLRLQLDRRVSEIRVVVVIHILKPYRHTR